ncbi:MAG: hypothetical protein JWR42_902 [Marmoricola sp.]|jgi:hypothetical protein|nr:hypothetical protein [Marmoricola sp.]
MVTAMVVLVGVILAYLGVQSLVTNQPSTAVRTVDWASVVPGARKAASFDLLAPSSLPRGWRATSVTFTDTKPSHWHLGVLTDADRYVGIEQGFGSVSSMVTDFVDDRATRGAAVDVAGRPWTTWTDGGGDLALVRRSAGVTTLVVGHEVPRSTLVSYTASLR